jgi:hypothetical protein
VYGCIERMIFSPVGLMPFIGPRLQASTKFLDVVQRGNEPWGAAATEVDMRHSRPLCMVVLVLVLSSAVMGGDAVSVADVPSAARDNPLAAWALDLLSDTRDRPLFSLRRRPPPPPAPPPPESVASAPETPPPNIALLAIVSDDGVAHAVVRTAEHKAICARLGSEVAGWTVTHIEPRRLMLSFGDRAVSFALFAGMNGKNTKTREPEPASPDVQMQNVAQRQTERRIGR